MALPTSEIKIRLWPDASTPKSPEGDFGTVKTGRFANILRNEVS